MSWTADTPLLGRSSGITASLAPRFLAYGTIHDVFLQQRQYFLVYCLRNVALDALPDLIFA